MTASNRTGFIQGKKPGFMWTVIFLLLLFPLVSAKNPAKRTNIEISQEYRDIAREMKSLYEKGKLHQVIETFTKKCLKENTGTRQMEKKTFKKMKKNIRAEIYNWLVLSYFAMDRPDLAGKYYRKLVTIWHDESDYDYHWDPLLEYFSRRYHIAPRWLLGLNIGGTFNMVQVGDRYSILIPAVGNGEDTYLKDYTIKFPGNFGVHVRLIIEFVLSKHISVITQPGFATYRFPYNYNLKWEDNGSSIDANFFHQNDLFYMELPLLLKWRSIGRKKHKLYLQIGGYIGKHIFSYKRIRSVLNQNDFQKTETVGRLDINEQINSLNCGLQAGIGIMPVIEIKRLRFQLGFELNYKHGFTNIVNENERFANKELKYRFYDIMDDMKLRTLELSFMAVFARKHRAFKKKRK